MAPLNENEPVKCADCKVWWRGREHKCDNMDRMTDMIMDALTSTDPKRKKPNAPVTPPAATSSDSDKDLGKKYAKLNKYYNDDALPRRIYPSGYTEGSEPTSRRHIVRCKRCSSYYWDNTNHTCLSV